MKLRSRFASDLGNIVRSKLFLARWSPQGVGHITLHTHIFFLHKQNDIMINTYACEQPIKTSVMTVNLYSNSICR